MRPYLIVASLIPVLLLIGYGVRKTNGSWLNPALWIGFLVGAGGGVLAYFVEQALVGWLHLAGTALTLREAAEKGFLVAAFPEEIFKFAGLLLITMFALEGKRLQDVLLLAVGIGMGFAGLENMLYLGHASAWQFIAVLRSVSAVPTHGILALIMGSLLIATVLSDGNRLPGLALTLLMPVVLHGTYDWLAMASGSGALSWTFPATVVAMTVSGLMAVALCNVVLPEAAVMDAHIDAGHARAPRKMPKLLVRSASGFLFLLIAIVRGTGYDATVCWMAAFLGVLPLTLAFDLIFTWLRGPPAPVAEVPLQA